MKNLLAIVQIILSLILTGLIFLQAKGTNENNSNILSQTGPERRGWEKIMFNFTLFVASLFLISSILQLTL